MDAAVQQPTSTLDKPVISFIILETSLLKGDVRTGPRTGGPSAPRLDRLDDFVLSASLPASTFILLSHYLPLKAT